MDKALIAIDIILVSYNHAKYIQQALKSIEEQVLPTGRQQRVIIADDDSADGTKDVIANWIKNTSLDTLLLPKTSNLGITKNYLRAFSASTADYIAILEADDYWCTSDHLQRHIDFLQTHPDYSISANRFIRFFEKQKALLPFMERHSVSEGTRHPEEHFVAFNHIDQCVENRLGNLSSVVLRGNLLRNALTVLSNLEVSYIDDWAIGIELSKFGPIAVHDSQSTVYRIHDNSVWSTAGNDGQYAIMMQRVNAYKKHYGGEIFNEAEQRIKQRYIPDKERNRLRAMPLWRRKIYRNLKKLISKFINSQKCR